MESGGASEANAPLSSEYGTYKTVKAGFWPWLEPFSRRKSLQPLNVFPHRSVAVIETVETQVCEKKFDGVGEQTLRMPQL